MSTILVDSAEVGAFVAAWSRALGTKHVRGSELHRLCIDEALLVGLYSNRTERVALAALGILLGSRLAGSTVAGYLVHRERVDGKNYYWLELSTCP
jgi:hypothetical protein